LKIFHHLDHESPFILSAAAPSAMHSA